MNDIMFTNILGEEFKGGQESETVYSLISYKNTFLIVSNILDNMLNASRNVGLEVFKHPNSIVEYHRKFECTPILFTNTYSQIEELGSIEIRSNRPEDPDRPLMHLNVYNKDKSFYYRNCKIINATLPEEVREKYFNKK